MELAYDHIHESALSPDERTQSSSDPNSSSSTPSNGSTSTTTATTLNTEFQEAYRAISSSPWGARLGGLFGSVLKQSESVYKEVNQELSAVSTEASKGLSVLQESILRSRNAAVTQEPLAVLRTGLTRIQKAEDAADEALLKAGTNIAKFFRDAVSIAPPKEQQDGSTAGSTVLFESKDSQGKRVIHTTRFDAQLHVIHASLESFQADPDSAEFAPWAESFDVEKKTEEIASDLDKYVELRAAMEKLVPDQVAYADFWQRYYFLRNSIETAEARRRDLLKGAVADTEEDVGWDEESDDEAPSKPTTTTTTTTTTTKAETIPRPASVASSTTIVQPPAPSQPNNETHLKVAEPRKSHDEKSQADSDGSYDVVGAASGAPSRAPGSPREVRKGEESEEEDWE